MTTYSFDDDSVVIIIGSGAGGGTLANELCQKGIPVVLLEAGARQSPATFINDEWPSFAQLSWGDTRTTSGSWQIAKDFPNLPAWICKTVGGTTTHWAGASIRLQEHEFRARQMYGEVKDANLLDWPLTLAELEPYYERAENKMGVTRTHDIPGLPGNNNFQVMYNGAKKLGYKECSTGHMAINSRGRDGRAQCMQLGFCFQGCKMGAKWSTLYTEIPAAEATGKLDLRTQAHAVRIEHDAKGRANAVVYADAQGQLHRQKGRIVAIAGNAIETPRLLLNSSSAMFPHGLGNGSGMV
ncbi:MAG: GMC family oxidoreductase N-terminal domain-containing protein, partial [Pseudomonas sp.]|nr:GMC family oxidoreductase N-terminal domain-containing protein [Pseudomonas sp.]